MVHTHLVCHGLNTNYDPIMKNRTTTLIVALTLAVCASVSAQSGQTDPKTQRAEQAKSLYNTGIIAMRKGQYDTATASFRGVLKLYPKHTQARRNLLHILNNRKSLEVGRRKSSLKNIIIPKVDLEQVTVQEALEVLGVMVTKESKKLVTPNFIVQDPTDTFKGRSVTLRLNRIPAETLLNYIIDQVGGRARYDSHAIIISPHNPKKVSTTEPKPAPATANP